MLINIIILVVIFAILIGLAWLTWKSIRSEKMALKILGTILAGR